MLEKFTDREIWGYVFGVLSAFVIVLVIEGLSP